jgi:exodeoxyribonuclease VII large subunit
LVARSRLELEGHLDHLSRRLAGQMQGRLALVDERLRGLIRRLRSPRQQLLLWQQRHAELVRRLDRAMERRQQETEGRLAALAGRLDLLSPLRTLERGYSIAFAEKTGKAVLDSGTLARGDRLRLHFARGRASATVEETGE